MLIRPKPDKSNSLAGGGGGGVRGGGLSPNLRVNQP